MCEGAATLGCCIAQRRIYSCTKLHKTELLYYKVYSKIRVCTGLYACTQEKYSGGLRSLCLAGLPRCRSALTQSFQFRRIKCEGICSYRGYYVTLIILLRLHITMRCYMNTPYPYSYDVYIQLLYINIPLCLLGLYC